jgi:hypothetical protein
VLVTSAKQTDFDRGAANVATLKDDRFKMVQFDRLPQEFNADTDIVVYIGPYYGTESKDTNEHIMHTADAEALKTMLMSDEGKKLQSRVLILSWFKLEREKGSIPSWLPFVRGKPTPAKRDGVFYAAANNMFLPSDALLSDKLASTVETLTKQFNQKASVYKPSIKKKKAVPVKSVTKKPKKPKTAATAASSLPVITIDGTATGEAAQSAKVAFDAWLKMDPLPGLNVITGEKAIDLDRLTESNYTVVNYILDKLADADDADTLSKRITPVDNTQADDDDDDDEEEEKGEPNDRVVPITIDGTATGEAAQRAKDAFDAWLKMDPLPGLNVITGKKAIDLDRLTESNYTVVNYILDKLTDADDADTLSKRITPVDNTQADDDEDDNDEEGEEFATPDASDAGSSSDADSVDEANIIPGGRRPRRKIQSDSDDSDDPDDDDDGVEPDLKAPIRLVARVKQPAVGSVTSRMDLHSLNVMACAFKGNGQLAQSVSDVFDSEMPIIYSIGRTTVAVSPACAAKTVEIENDLNGDEPQPPSTATLRWAMQPLARIMPALVSSLLSSNASVETIRTSFQAYTVRVRDFNRIVPLSDVFRAMMWARPASPVRAVYSAQLWLLWGTVMLPQAPSAPAAMQKRTKKPFRMQDFVLGDDKYPASMADWLDEEEDIDPKGVAAAGQGNLDMRYTISLMHSRLSESGSKNSVHDEAIQLYSQMKNSARFKRIVPRFDIEVAKTEAALWNKSNPGFIVSVNASNDDFDVATKAKAADPRDYVPPDVRARFTDLVWGDVTTNVALNNLLEPYGIRMNPTADGKFIPSYFHTQAQLDELFTQNAIREKIATASLKDAALERAKLAYEQYSLATTMRAKLSEVVFNREFGRIRDLLAAKNYRIVLAGNDVKLEQIRTLGDANKTFTRLVMYRAVEAASAPGLKKPSKATEVETLAAQHDVDKNMFLAGISGNDDETVKQITAEIRQSVNALNPGKNIQTSFELTSNTWTISEISTAFRFDSDAIVAEFFAGADTNDVTARFKTTVTSINYASELQKFGLKIEGAGVVNAQPSSEMDRLKALARVQSAIYNVLVADRRTTAFTTQIKQDLDNVMTEYRNFTRLDRPSLAQIQTIDEIVQAQTNDLIKASHMMLTRDLKIQFVDRHTINRSKRDEFDEKTSEMTFDDVKAEYGLTLDIKDHLEAVTANRAMHALLNMIAWLGTEGEMYRPTNLADRLKESDRLIQLRASFIDGFPVVTDTRIRSFTAADIANLTTAQPALAVVAGEIEDPFVTLSKERIQTSDGKALITERFDELMKEHTSREKIKQEITALFKFDEDDVTSDFKQTKDLQFTLSVFLGIAGQDDDRSFVRKLLRNVYQKERALTSRFSDGKPPSHTPRVREKSELTKLIEKTASFTAQTVPSKDDIIDAFDVIAFLYNELTTEGFAYLSDKIIRASYPTAKNTVKLKAYIENAFFTSNPNRTDLLQQLYDQGETWNSLADLPGAPNNAEIKTRTGHVKGSIKRLKMYKALSSIVPDYKGISANVIADANKIVAIDGTFQIENGRVVFQPRSKTMPPPQPTEMDKIIERAIGNVLSVHVVAARKHLGLAKQDDVNSLTVQLNEMGLTPQGEKRNDPDLTTWLSKLRTVDFFNKLGIQNMMGVDPNTIAELGTFAKMKWVYDVSSYPLDDDLMQLNSDYLFRSSAQMTLKQNGRYRLLTRIETTAAKIAEKIESDFGTILPQVKAYTTYGDVLDNFLPLLGLTYSESGDPENDFSYTIVDAGGADRWRAERFSLDQNPNDENAKKRFDLIDLRNDIVKVQTPVTPAVKEKTGGYDAFIAMCDDIKAPESIELKAKFQTSFTRDPSKIEPLTRERLEHYSKKLGFDYKEGIITYNSVQLVYIGSSNVSSVAKLEKDVAAAISDSDGLAADQQAVEDKLKGNSADLDNLSKSLQEKCHGIGTRIDALKNNVTQWNTWQQARQRLPSNNSAFLAALPAKLVSLSAGLASASTTVDAEQRKIDKFIAAVKATKTKVDDIDATGGLAADKSTPEYLTLIKTLDAIEPMTSASGSLIPYGFIGAFIKRMLASHKYDVTLSARSREFYTSLRAVLVKDPAIRTLDLTDYLQELDSNIMSTSASSTADQQTADQIDAIVNSDAFDRDTAYAKLQELKDLDATMPLSLAAKQRLVTKLDNTLASAKMEPPEPSDDGDGEGSSQGTGDEESGDEDGGQSLQDEKSTVDEPVLPASGQQDGDAGAAKTTTTITAERMKTYLDSNGTASNSKSGITFEDPDKNAILAVPEFRALFDTKMSYSKITTAAMKAKLAKTEVDKGALYRAFLKYYRLSAAAPAAAAGDEPETEPEAAAADVVEKTPQAPTLTPASKEFSKSIVNEDFELDVSRKDDKTVKRGDIVFYNPENVQTAALVTNPTPGKDKKIGVLKFPGLSDNGRADPAKISHARILQGIPAEKRAQIENIIAQKLAN